MSEEEQDFIDDVVEIGSPTPEIENDPLPPPDQGGPGPRNVSRLQMDFEEAQKNGKDKGYTVELINNDYELWSIKFFNLDVVPHPNQIAKYKEKYRRDYTPFKDQMEQYKKKYGQNYLYFSANLSQHCSLYPCSSTSICYVYSTCYSWWLNLHGVINFCRMESDSYHQFSDCRNFCINDDRRFR